MIVLSRSNDNFYFHLPQIHTAPTCCEQCCRAGRRLSDHATCFPTSDCGPQPGNIRPEIMAFALEMEKRMRAYDHRPGWLDIAAGEALRGINSNHHRIDLGLASGARMLLPERIRAHAADIGNYAMFLAFVVGHTKSNVY